MSIQRVSNHILGLTLTACALTGSASAWADEVWNCHAGKGQFTDTLSLTIAKGSVMSFAYNSTAGAYTCEARAKRGDDETKWSDNGKNTRVQFEEGVAVIEKGSNSYKVRLNRLPSSYFCGLNGQMAQEVIITRHNNSCKVK